MGHSCTKKKLSHYLFPTLIDATQWQSGHALPHFCYTTAANGFTQAVHLWVDVFSVGFFRGQVMTFRWQVIAYKIREIETFTNKHGKKEQVTDIWQALKWHLSKKNLQHQQKHEICILIKKSPNLLRLLSINRNADASLVFGVIFLS